MKEEMRNLDILIAEKVFGGEIVHLNQKGGFNVDYMVKDKNSKANEPIYAMDMVHDYRVKYFSTRKEYVFELIAEINKKNKTVELSQLDNGQRWAVSSWHNNYEKDKEFQGENLLTCLCVLALSIYNYDVTLLLKKLKIQHKE
jgi:hypothetical protein